MSYLYSFNFSIFSFPDVFFLYNIYLFCFSISDNFFFYILYFFFFLSKLFISVVLLSVMSYFQSFHLSIFSFPEAFLSQNAAFPEFCALECLISKVLIFQFLASQKLFFAKRCISGVLHSRTSF